MSLMSADDPSGFSANGPHDGKVEQKPAPWWIYRGTGRPLQNDSLHELLPPPPPWRSFRSDGPVQPPPPADEADLERRLGPIENLRWLEPDPKELDAVNAALYLRRPLLVTGKPGVGKTSLAYRVSRELGLGRVLKWPISSRSTLRNGLYEYDAIGRAQDAATARQSGGKRSADDISGDTGIGAYLRLGPLGTALLPYELPRVLLIDELDKSDIDLPNDLLDIFEEGEYSIPELVRVSARESNVKVHTADPKVMATIREGHVRCREFPVIIITSNAEREFPPAFLRRCLRFAMKEPDEGRLANMVAAHFAGRADEHLREMVHEFLEHRRARGGLAADQLLNAVHLATSGAYTADKSWQQLLDLIWQRLGEVAE
jgi:MoxR-like ATPase